MASVKTEYRLEIEGFGYQPVTHADLEQSISSGEWDDAVRTVGLSREGLIIEEEVDVARAEWEGSPMDVQIVDRRKDDTWTNAFARQPTIITYLTTSMNTAATTMVVQNTDDFTGSGIGSIIHIGTETMRVDSIDSATQFTVTRAQWGTIAQQHDVSDGAQLRNPRVTQSRPTTLEGRRCRLYRYVRGTDDLQGDGNLIWRGIVATDAKLVNATTWQLTLDPLTRLLDQDLGADLKEPTTVRGIYYPGNAKFYIKLEERDGFTVVNSAEVEITGFFETQQAFLAEVNSQLASETSGWSNGASVNTAQSVEAGPLDGGWGITYVTASSNPARVVLADTSEAARKCDGFKQGDFRSPGEGSVSASKALTIRTGRNEASLPGAGQVPRGVFGYGNGGNLGDFVLGASDSPTRLFFADTASPDSNDSLGIKWAGEDETVYPSLTWRSADRSADLLFSALSVDLSGQRFFAAGNPPEIRILRRYVVSGDLADFRDELVSTSPSLANSGAMPFITSEDLASWTSVVSEAASDRRLATDRRYVGSDAVNFLEFLAMECRLIGVYPHLDTDGKITLSLLRLPTASEVADITITDNDILTDEGFPTWERNALGSINTYVLHTGYDHIEDEHKGPTYSARDVSAFGVRKTPLALEVEPKSEANRATISAEEVVAMAQPVLGIFGRPYSVIRLKVHRDIMDDVLVGKRVSLTLSMLPDITTGDRGMSSKMGIIIGRRWELGMGENGEITVLLSDANLKGWSPSLYVSGQTNVSGNTWDLTVSDQFGGSGDTMMVATDAFSDHWAAGYQVRIYKFDDSSTAFQAGEVVSVNDAGTIRVTFTSTWTPGSDTWILEYDEASGGNVAAQFNYAYWANSNGYHPETGSGDVPGTEYAG